MSIPALRTEPERVLVYEERFEKGTGGWLCYTPEGTIREADLGVLPDGTRGIYSSAPWWVDPNHANGGMGYLHLVAFHPLRAGVTLGLLRGLSGVPDPTLSLPGARLTVEMTVKDFEPHRSHLLFWFQRGDAKTGKGANIAFIGRPLEQELRDRVRTTLTLDLVEDECAWGGLGSCRQKEYMYGTDMSLGEAMRHVNVDFGFILLPINPQTPPTGSVLIHSVSIEEDRKEHEKKIRDYSAIDGLDYAMNAMGMAMRIARHEEVIVEGVKVQSFDIAMRLGKFAASQYDCFLTRDTRSIAALMGIVCDYGIIRPSWSLSSLLARDTQRCNDSSSEIIFKLAFELESLDRCSLIYWFPGFAGEDTMIVLPLSSPKEASQ